VLNTTLPMKERAKAALKSGLTYAWWYPSLWIPALTAGTGNVDPAFRSDLRKVRNLSRKLARKLFHSMLRYGPKLDKKQVLLGRFVDVGAELYAQTSSIALASHQLAQGTANSPDDLRETVRYFCKLSRGKIATLLREVRNNADKEGYRVARQLIEG
jgi:hypothetical protein